MPIYTGSPIPQVVVNVAQGATYTITPGGSETGLVLVNGSQSVIMSVGVPITLVAQGTTLVFEYPQLIPPDSVYSGVFYAIHNLNNTTAYNIVFGANENELINLAGTPGSLFASGQFTTSVFPTVNLYNASGNVPVTGQLYLAANNVPFTAQIFLLHPAPLIVVQLTSIQLFTSKLGGVDYRFGTDFPLVLADPINTNFNTPNLNLPFVFPVGSTSQLNPPNPPITQPR